MSRTNTYTQTLVAYTQTPNRHRSPNISQAWGFTGGKLGKHLWGLINGFLHLFESGASSVKNLPIQARPTGTLIFFIQVNSSTGRTLGVQLSSVDLVPVHLPDRSQLAFGLLAPVAQSLLCWLTHDSQSLFDPCFGSKRPSFGGLKTFEN